ncbi:MAG TPA: hypothetical protein VGF48_05385 [Thermoanaerobaculia bacterium]
MATDGQHAGWSRLAVLIGTFLLVGCFGTASACPITVHVPLKYAFKVAPIAFEGVLERIDENGDAHFTILQQWKGMPVTAVVVSNPPTTCAYTGLRVGERYVVVPEQYGGIKSGSHVEITDTASTTRELLNARACWWRSPLSSFAPGAILRAIGRRLP